MALSQPGVHEVKALARDPGYPDVPYPPVDRERLVAEHEGLLPPPEEAARRRVAK